MHHPAPQPPRWLASVHEAIWHHPISGGADPRMACGKKLKGPVHGARSTVPPGLSDIPANKRRDRITPARRNVCNHCATVVDLEGNALDDAVHRIEELTAPAPEAIEWPPKKQDSELAAAA